MLQEEVHRGFLYMGLHRIVQQVEAVGVVFPKGPTNARDRLLYRRHGEPPRPQKTDVASVAHGDDQLGRRNAPRHGSSDVVRLDSQSLPEPSRTQRPAGANACNQWLRCTARPHLPLAVELQTIRALHHKDRRGHIIQQSDNVAFGSQIRHKSKGASGR